MNRAQGPDRVLDLAAERLRAPDADLENALPMTERTQIAAGYKATAGFDPAILNARASLSPN
jgi:hypothetical protein